ncbi:MAG: ferrous iron transporter B [Ruminococcaceae bacterium]|nr:ferrous iron transporter B [Oscillospiraceae bacterium]
MELERPAQKRTVALVGNPNVGKSTLFNTLTGLRQHTGNWPGKTVGVATGYLSRGNITFEFVDLPGTYALSGGSEEEQIASAFITSQSADWTVAVCDGVSLERSLILALQAKEYTSNFILYVSLMDEAERMGIHIDGEKLSQLLDAPVVLSAAGRKDGIEKLLQLLSAPPPVPKKVAAANMNAVSMAESIAAQCVTKDRSKAQPWRKKVDEILVSRTWGVLILLSLLMLLIWLTVYGANIPSQMLEALLNKVYQGLQWLFGWMPDGLKGFLLDGAYATTARVLSVMLPPMAIFFPLFSLLEDVGYLPRMAFLLDGGMRRCGGCGKQALTMCMGLGCNAVGVTGCRIIQSPKERLLAILTNAMIPCNGRFPTLILLAGLGFGSWAPLAVGGCVVLGVFGAMLTSGILSKTACRHACSHFLMEIPPLRRPRIGQILVRSLLDRTLRIAARAVKVAAPAGMLLWLLAHVGWLQLIARFVNPIGILFGMNGILLLGFLLSLPANELLLPIVLMTLTGGTGLQDFGSAETVQLLAVLSLENLLCSMVFTLFHWPCATTIATIYAETRSYKKTAAAICLPTAVGLLICFLLHVLFRYLGG